MLRQSFRKLGDLAVSDDPEEGELLMGARRMAIPCVERVSRLKPSVSSSSFMCLLTTEGVVRRSAAALVKLRRSATRTKVLSLFRSRSAAVKDIVLPLSKR